MMLGWPQDKPRRSSTMQANPSALMALYLRKVSHPQAHDNDRVVLKREDGDFESDQSAFSTVVCGLGELIPRHTDAPLLSRPNGQGCKCQEPRASGLSASAGSVLDRASMDQRPLPLCRQNEPLRVQPCGQVPFGNGMASCAPARGTQNDPDDV
jgi:hypothetical protein